MTNKYTKLVPELLPDDYAALKADIAKVGVLIPVEYDELGNILDGFHRVRACGELGITTWPRIKRLGFTEEEKRTHARRLNLARRHLTSAQKRCLIEAQLTETPQLTNVEIATTLGVDDTTVGDARKRLESVSGIPTLERVTGRDGKSYPRKKFKATMPIGTPMIATPTTQQARLLNTTLAQRRTKTLDDHEAEMLRTLARAIEIALRDYDEGAT